MQALVSRVRQVAWRGGTSIYSILDNPISVALGAGIEDDPELSVKKKSS